MSAVRIYELVIVLVAAVFVARFSLDLVDFIVLRLYMPIR